MADWKLRAPVRFHSLKKKHRRALRQEVERLARAISGRTTDDERSSEMLLTALQAALSGGASLTFTIRPGRDEHAPPAVAADSEATPHPGVSADLEALLLEVREVTKWLDGAGQLGSPSTKSRLHWMLQDLETRVHEILRKAQGRGG